MLHAVIMAGGAGTRFWPASRTAKPKQLLDLAVGRSMLQATVDRLEGLVPAERMLVVTNERLIAPIRAQLPGLPAAAIIGEPCKRDTAPCIGLAALLVSRDDPDATLVVMPSDHVIQPAERFREALAAAGMVEASRDRIVTFGIPPTYPAETFGYIERGEPLASEAAAVVAYQVKRFREKPSVEVAGQFLATGGFYWNAGIFVWRVRTIIDALARHEPEMHAHLQAIGDALGRPEFAAVFAREFAAIQGKSIDYAVMERHREVVVIEATFEWDDVGNWQSLARTRGCDEHGNTIVAPRHLALRTTGSIIRSEGEHLIVTLGLKDCIVVHTPDATLVANKHDEESIRQIVQMLKERGWEEYL